MKVRYVPDNYSMKIALPGADSPIERADRDAELKLALESITQKRRTERMLFEYINRQSA